jgi:methylated-DNA-[protein]-cysteine S-methyltransferase
MKTALPPLHATLWDSPVGRLRLLAHDGALCGVYFDDQRGIPVWAHHATLNDRHPVLQDTVAQLQAYFQGQLRQFDLPLAILEGTVFQRDVWQQLQRIPYGQMVSYGQLAALVGRPAAVRAVGGAVGRNPLGIVLPCHRVVVANGQMTGYTGGLDRKEALLRLEAA